MPKILCVKKEALPCELQEGVGYFKWNIEEYIELEKCSWQERSLIENDYTFMQIIPYIVLHDNDNIACYQRHGNEKRIHGLWSCGVGGHIEECDLETTLQGTILTGATRELNEEVKLIKKCLPLKYCGIITEDKTKVGLTHLGIVFEANVAAEQLLPQEELKNFTWLQIGDFLNNKHELWSELSLELIKENT